MGLFSLFEKKVESKQVIEPLGLAFADWQLARVVGDETKSKQVLSIFQATCIDPNSLLQAILGRGKSRDGARLIKDEPMSLLGGKRTVEIGNHKIEIVIGLPEEVDSYLTENNGREAELALENGFLPLIVAESYNEKTKLQYLGTLLYEPQVNKKYFFGEKKFLSVLPSALIAYYVGKTAEYQPMAVEADELMSGTPQQIEQKLKTVSIIGSASLRDRHHILSLLHNAGSFKYLSTNSADEGLQKTDS